VGGGGGEGSRHALSAEAHLQVTDVLRLDKQRSIFKTCESDMGREVEDE